MKRRQSSSAPSYQLHKPTGQARVRIHGKDYYLGKHGSQESRQRYKLLLADKWNPQGTVIKPTLPETDQEITISFGC